MGMSTAHHREKNMKSVDVVGVGYCTLDYVTLVNKYPEIDTKIEVIDFVEDGGGPTATALVTLSRFGIHTRFIGKVGNDQRGNLIHQQLHREGVDLSGFLREVNKISPLSLIVVDKFSGKRTIIYTKGDAVKIRPDEIKREHLLGAKILHIDGHQVEASLLACRWAKELGIMVVLDAGSVRPGMSDLLAASDYVISSRSFALDFTSAGNIEDAAESIFSKGNHAAVAVTNGEKGGFCISNTSKFHYTAQDIEVTDTTGAGDVFHGAFDYGLLQGWPLEKIVNFSSIVAGLKCRRLGGRIGIPNLEQALAILASMDGGN
jgi:sulfofructose kinase